MANTIARSRSVRSAPTSALTSTGERILGNVRGTRTSGTCWRRPPRRRVDRPPRGTGFDLTDMSPRATRYAYRPEIDDSRRATVHADNPHSPSLIRTTVRSPRCCARKSNTSAATTSAGSLSTTPKNVFRSCATARSVLARARPATNAR
jgi:hypothetical protein